MSSLCLIYCKEKHNPPIIAGRKAICFSLNHNNFRTFNKDFS